MGSDTRRTRTFQEPSAGDVGLAATVAAHAYGLPAAALAGAGRGDSRVSRARQVAMYLAHGVLEMTIGQIARAFGRDRSTVSHACRCIEDAREDPNIDRTMDWLETLLRRSAGMAA